MNGDDLRTHTILLRVSLNDLRLIDAKMREAGKKNRSAYLRDMALDGYIIKQNFEVWRAASYELRKIGNNVNQLARAANDYGIETVKTAEIKKVQEALRGLWQQLISAGSHS